MASKSTAFSAEDGALDPHMGLQIETLTRQTAAKFEIVLLPKEALPSGVAVEQPSIGLLTDGEGNISIVNLASHAAGLAGKPLRREGTARATTLGSFVGLVNRHASPNSAVFADANWKAPKFTAVIDYNEPAMGADVEPGDDPHARFGKHRVAYEFPLSEAWKVWIKFNKEPMGQADFAAFLEDHIHEVSSPTQEEVNTARDQFKTTVANPTDLITLSRGMEVVVGARVKSKVNLASGEKQIIFESENRDINGKELLVPGLFVVSVAPFYQGEAMRIFARLRYRPAEGGIVWFYELYRPDLAIEARVTDDLLTVARETNLPTFHGSPEA